MKFPTLSINKITRVTLYFKLLKLTIISTFDFSVKKFNLDSNLTANEPSTMKLEPSFWPLEQTQPK